MKTKPNNLKKRTILFLCLICIGITNGRSQEKNKIDLEVEDCINKLNIQSTASMNKCVNQGYAKWDKQLNIVYEELRKKLSPNSAQLLLQSQRNWIKYRDSEFKLLNSIYYEDLTGTFWQNIITGKKYNFLKERVLQLQYINEDLEEM